MLFRSIFVFFRNISGNNVTKNYSFVCFRIYRYPKILTYFLDACLHWQSGRKKLGVNVMLCKPYRHAVGVSPGMISMRNPGDSEWVEYWARNKRHLLRFLPHTLALFLVENFWEQLRLPDPPRPFSNVPYYEDDRHHRWSMHELNKILRRVLVRKADGTQLQVLGGVRWESDRFVGSMQLRVRTLDEHYGKTRQVFVFVFRMFFVMLII